MCFLLFRCAFHVFSLFSCAFYVLVTFQLLFMSFSLLRYAFNMFFTFVVCFSLFRCFLLCFSFFRCAFHVLFTFQVLFIDASYTHTGTICTYMHHMHAQLKVHICAPYTHACIWWDLASDSLTITENFILSKGDNSWPDWC